MAKRCVLRSTSGKPSCTCFFPLPSSSSPLLSAVLYYHLRSPPLYSSLSLSKPIPFAFFGRSSRKQNEAPPRSRFHTSSLLSPYLFLARKSSRHLHNTLGDVLFFLTIFVHIHSSHFRRVDTLFFFFLSLSSFFFFLRACVHRANYEEGVEEEWNIGQ